MSKAVTSIVVAAQSCLEETADTGMLVFGKWDLYPQRRGLAGDIYQFRPISLLNVEGKIFFFLVY